MLRKLGATHQGDEEGFPIPRYAKSKKKSEKRFPKVF
jgi:hypothetical protein